MAQQKDLSLMTFENKFNTAAKREKYLFKQRFPKGFVCPECGHNEYYYLKNRKLYQCKECKHQTSITAGTVMHRSRISLKKWFWTIYLTSTDKGGIAATTLSERLKVSYPTAWLMLHKIREAMKNRDNHYQLGNIIEIDDAFFGGKDEGNKRGRGTRKAKVLVQLSTSDEGKPEFAKMTIVEDMKEKTIMDEIRNNVKTDTTIKTDGFRAYNGLSADRYNHITVDYIMRWVHIVISNAKTFMKGTYHGACDEHLQKYLDEFCYRFNRRFWEGQLFNRLITACLNSNAITYKDLVGLALK